MTAYADLLPDVLPDVPGCSDPLAERAIRDAVIRLCELSDIVKHTSDPSNIVAEDPSYIIVVPPGYAYNQVLWVTVEGEELAEASQDYLDLAWREENERRALFSHYHTVGFSNEASGWRTFAQQRPEVYFVERENDVDALRLVGIPTSDITGGLQYRISLKPLREATEVRDFVIEDHYRIIVKGALGALFTMNKKQWTDTTRGVALTNEFDAECADLKRLALKDFTRDDEATGRTRAYP